MTGFAAVASVSGVRFSYGVVLPELSADLSAPTSAVALAFTVHWLAFAASSPLAWRFFVRYGVRAMFRLGGVLCGGGFALLAVVHTPWQAVACFGIVVGVGTHGIGQLAATQPVLATATEAGRDRLFGVVACGSPVGIAAFPALTALAVDIVGWRQASIATGALVALVACGASYFVPWEPPGAERTDEAPDAAASGQLWRDASFGFLAGAFFLSLIVQTAVPLALPLWGADRGFSAAQLATAFVILGVSGVLARLLFAAQPPWFSLRLWVVIPAALLGVAGCAAAEFGFGQSWLYVSVALLGLGTSVYGALFAVAAVACYPSARFPEVTGSLLLPVGLGAALAPVLPTLSVDHGVPFGVMWLCLAAVTSATAALFLTAELVSPARRRG